MRARIFLGLILCNLIWSANPMMGKILLTYFSAPVSAWIRHVGALISYLMTIVVIRKYKDLPPPVAAPRTRQDAIQMTLLGFLTFCFAPFVGFLGLSKTQASDNSLIIGMEPLITIFLAQLFLGDQKISRRNIVSYAGAFLGFILISGFQSKGGSHWLGNAILLIALFGEGAYSVIGRKLMTRLSPISVFGSALVVGFVFLSATALLSRPVAPVLNSGDWIKIILAAAWIGPLGTAATYLFWLLALTEAPVPSVAISLYVQPIFGCFLAFVFLHELLTAYQLLGGAIIFVSVLYESFMKA